MSFSALLFTAAAVAFFTLMVMRPPVDPTTPTTTATDQKSSTAPETPATDTTEKAEKQPGAEETEAEAGAQPDDTENTDDTENNEGKPGEESKTENDQPAVAADKAVADKAVADKAVADKAVADPAALPDYRREQRLVNEISDTILDGEVLFLHDGKRNFMSIQTDADEARGGAIILHGRGLHADWEDTINPLRTGLVETGWTTLSLQMPVLGKQAKYYDYVPLFPEAGQRIKAGIQHLKDQGISPIVLIAHSCGGHMAMHWLDQHGDSDIAAFVGLGMGATDYQQPMAKPFAFEKMQVPIFDVYGENEYPAVIKMAPQRWASIKVAGNPQSEQRVLPGADHYFKNKGDELTELVATWLNGLKL